MNESGQNLIKPIDKNVVTAKVKTEELIEQSHLDEAIKVIEELETEVTGMKISEKFSKTAKPTQEILNQNPINSFLLNLTEVEYEREILSIELNSIKRDLNYTITKIKEIVLKIEAIKQE